MRSVGGAIGVAIFNTVLNSQNNAHLGPAVTNAALGAGATMAEVPALIAAALVPAKLVVAAHGNMALVEAIIHTVQQTRMNSYR